MELGLTLFLPLAGACVLAASTRFVGPSVAPATIAASLLAVATITAASRGAPSQGQVVQRRRRRQLLVILGSVSFLAAAAWYAEPRPLTRLAPSTLRVAYEEDAKLLAEHRQSLAAVLARLERLDVPQAGREALRPRDEEVLLASFQQILHLTLATERIRRFHEDYYRFDVADRRFDHVTAFLLTFAADATIYDAAARFAVRVRRNENAATFLDAPRDGLPAGSYGLFESTLLGAEPSLRISAGERYASLVKLAASSPLGPLRRRLRGWLARDLERIDELGHLERFGLASSAEIKPIGHMIRDVWFPLQKGAAEALGDTRVRRIGRYLIDRSLREEVAAMLEPGDVLLARKNWYLSNVALPGFWPHAILYVGTPKELARYFDTPPVQAWSHAQFGTPSFADALAQRFPAAWASYQRRDHGEPRRALEAISEGVSFSSLAACAGDYLAALRPRLDRLAKAQAIADAFAQFGKPYDFDFDFATDHALVCTELVWRAYRPAPGKAGLDFDLTTVAGRLTLPAHDIARELVREGPRSDLSFIAFVDASERDGRAFLSDRAGFEATVDRLKWDIAQR